MDDIKQYARPRGFAALSIERRKEIAAQGGKTAHETGSAHRWTPEQARAAALKGHEARRQRKLAP